ncbi:MAG: hypothetical protein HY720_02020 [Planctomycetes bacterium]|nr:hypothetical protein [Planctomycetota bacterium]
MEFLKKYWMRAVTAFKGLTVPQRLSIGALAATVTVALVLLAVWGASDDMVPVFFHGYDKVDAEQAGRIEAKLAEMGIRYEYRNGILHVPAAEKERVIAALYAEPGVLPGTDDVWSWIWEPDWTGTEQRTKRKVTISLERKLERMIGSFEQVRDAKVQIAPGDENRTFAEEKPARASVLLVLKEDRQLSQNQVTAVAQMLAGAVQDLSPADVQISDTNGRYYKVSDPEEFGTIAADHLDLKKKWDEYTVEQARGALGPLGKVAYVTASVTLDMTRSNEASHTLPTGGRPASERTREETRKTGATGPEEPGVVTNTEKALAAGSETTEETISEGETTSDQSYTDKRTETPPGRVTSSRVVVYLPYEEAVKSPSGETPSDETVREANRQAAINQYKTALGTLTAGAQTDIHVDIVRFPPAPEYPQPTMADWARYLLEDHGGKLFLGVVALAALIFVGRAMKRSIPPAPEEVVPVEEERIDKNLDALMRARTPGRFDPRTQVVRDKIQDIIDENPRGVAAMLRQWVKKE